MEGMIVTQEKGIHGILEIKIKLPWGGEKRAINHYLLLACKNYKIYLWNGMLNYFFSSSESILKEQ